MPSKVERDGPFHKNVLEVDVGSTNLFISDILICVSQSLVDVGCFLMIIDLGKFFFLASATLIEKFPDERHGEHESEMQSGIHQIVELSNHIQHFGVLLYRILALQES